ncbi:MAG: amidotransferase 1, exosortase A system-associated [Alphaproteobacteria bacterium]|nr:MAG: amidotransferase 1, exosortase A system-associated [Alphaproteobacteria bacterium]
MCGITGIMPARADALVSRPLLAAMNAMHVHRGPDEEGLYLAPGVGLGHRRLSIIDLASGQQPMHSGDGACVICYNGEVYNFPELRRVLEARGHRFRTHCDTEVILNAYIEWGEDSVRRLRGMFAFAIWDSRRRALFLARDRLGIKPLHYAHLGDGTFLFGSELKSLLRHPGLSRAVDPLAVEDYFALGYVPDPKTILRDVRKLPAGHVMTVRHGGHAPEPRSYWHLRFAARPVADVRALEDELIARLREAVRMRLVADVPLGAFLSGGVDSSAVVALMAGLLDKPVNSCAIGFDHAPYDETHYARRVAARYGTDHDMRIVAADDYGLVDKLAFHYDEPFADNSAIPTYRVSELARRRVIVALSGDGGDELFAGYRRYRMHMGEEAVRALLPMGLRRVLFGALGRHYPKLDWAPRFMRAKTTFEALAMPTGTAYAHTMSLTPEAERAALYSAGFKRQLDGYRAAAVIEAAIRDAPCEDALSRIQYADIKTNLVGDILTKVDRASMAHGLEVRVPLLDHEFVEWAAGIPANLKLRRGEGKAVFKRALKPFLDRDLLYRPKMGFVSPIGEWLRGPLRARIEDLVHADRLHARGYFNAEKLARMVAAHTAGRRDHSRFLWALLMFDASLRHIDAMDAHTPTSGVAWSGAAQ